MKIYFTLALTAILSVAGCKAPSPAITDDTLVTSTVDGVQLVHRHAVQPPTRFIKINKTWRALYNASIMTTPDYSGNVVRHLVNGKPFTVLGRVNNNWLAIAEHNNSPLIGYVPTKAGVPQERYATTLRKEKLRPRAADKPVCINVGGNNKACRQGKTATWILN